MRYAIDIDNTLVKTHGSDYNNSVPIQSMIDRVNKLHDDGNTVYLFTARGSASGKDHSQLTHDQMKRFGVKYDKIIFGKPDVDIFVDDKAISAKEWSNRMDLKIYKMHQDTPDVKYGTKNSACFDIAAHFHYQNSFQAFSTDNKNITILGSQDEHGKHFVEIPPEWRMLIPTGLILDIPENHCVKIYPRSGLSTKKGLNLINSVGIIDSDYVQQLMIPLYNNSQERLRIYSGDRIAQGELVQQMQANITYIEERPTTKTDRSGGFGSTGV